MCASEDGVAVADCGEGAHDPLDRLVNGGAFEAGVGEAGGGVGERVGGQCVEQCFPIGVVAIQGGTADAGRGCDVGHVGTTAVFGKRVGSRVEDGGRGAVIAGATAGGGCRRHQGLQSLDFRVSGQDSAVLTSLQDNDT